VNCSFTSDSGIEIEIGSITFESDSGIEIEIGSITFESDSGIGSITFDIDSGVEVGSIFLGSDIIIYNIIIILYQNMKKM